MESGKANIQMSSLTFSDTNFRLRLVRRFRVNSLFGGFNPAVSPSALNAMRQTIRDLNIRCQTQLSLQDIPSNSILSFEDGLRIMGALLPRRSYPLLRYVN